MKKGRQTILIWRVFFVHRGHVAGTPGVPLRCTWDEKSIQPATTTQVIAGMAAAYMRTRLLGCVSAAVLFVRRQSLSGEQRKRAAKGEGDRFPSSRVSHAAWSEWPH